MSFSTGAVTVNLKAKIDDLVNKFKSAGQTLEKFGDTSQKAFSKASSGVKSYQDRIDDLVRRKSTLSQKLAEVSQKFGENSIQAQNVSNRMLSLQDRADTLRLKMSELGKHGGSMFDSLIDKAGKLTKSVGSGLVSAFGMAIEKGKQLAIGLGVIATGFATWGIASAKTAEMSMIAFEGLLGSADKAKALLGDLVKFAKVTPFNLENVKKYAENLIAAQIPQEQIVETLRMLGNVSRGVPAKMDLISLAFTQVRTAGKLTGAELRQFSENGVPLLDLLSKKFNKTGEEIRKMIKENKISFQDVNDVMMEYSRTHDLMAEGAKSFTGRLSNLQDTLQLTAMRLIGVDEIGQVLEGGLFDLATKGVGWLSEQLEKNQEIINDVLKGFGQLAEVLFTGNFRGGVLSEDSALVKGAFLLRDIMGGIKQTLEVIFTGNFSGGFLGEDSRIIKGAFLLRDLLLEIKRLSIDFWKAFTKVINSNKKVFDDLQKALDNLFTEIKTAIQGLGIETNDWGTILGTVVGGAIIKLVELITWAVNATTDLIQLMKEAWKVIEPIVTVFIEEIQLLIDFFQGKITADELLSGLSDLSSRARAILTEWIGDVWNWYWAEWVPWANELGGKIMTAVWDGLVWLVTTGIPTLAGWTIDKLNNEWLPAFTNWSRNVERDAFQWLGGAFMNMLTTIYIWMQGIIPGMTAWLRSEWQKLVEDTKKLFQGLGDIDLGKIGRKIGKSLVDGFNEEIKKVTDKLNSLSGSGSVVGSMGGTMFDSITGAFDKNADGTRDYPGGWSWVGEEGPELMYVPKGSDIYSNPESKQMSNTQNVTFNINGVQNPTAIWQFINKQLANQNNLANNGINI